MWTRFQVTQVNHPQGLLVMTGTHSDLEQTMANSNPSPVSVRPSPNPENMIQLTYVSSQTQALSARELLALLEEARVLNNARSITGLLLHKEQSFFQVLEGPAGEVRRTFTAIQKDPRHQHVEVLSELPVDKREYQDWRMGFVDLDGIDPKLLEGYSDFMQKSGEPREFLANLGKSERLALIFRDFA